MTNLKEINIIKTFSLHSKLDDYRGGIGIGDDCAVIPSSSGVYKVVTTDTLTEDTHFILDKISPEDLAYKSLASNISDIISMGARPLYAFLAITFTDAIDQNWIDKFAASFQNLAAKSRTTLLGGDTTYSKHALTITITLIGEAPKHNIKLRSGAKVGDKIFCCNPLGGSALGLSNILKGNTNHPSIEAHYHPTLFIEQAIWLGEKEEVGAMMDISDGIAKDITHIMERSSVGAAINIDSIPIYIGADINMALTGGEEYSLLFTVRADKASEIKEQYHNLFGLDIFEIGEITPLQKGLKYLNKGVEVEDIYRGYTHNSK